MYTDKAIDEIKIEKQKREKIVNVRCDNAMF